MSKKIAFIGGGNMAEAVLAGLVRNQTVSPGDILVTEKNPERRAFLEKTYQIDTTDDNAQAARQSKTIFLAVKPYILDEIKDEIKDHLSEDHVVISILAGISRERLGKALGRVQRMVRVMPNLPAQVGMGVSAITFPESFPTPDRDWVRSILQSTGRVVEVEEPLQDAVTAVSGSGPGYLFYLADLFIQAGVQQGLSEPVAKSLVVETMAGAAEVLRRSNDSPTELVKKVATPGGTTEAGLSVLKENDLSGIMQSMVNRAAARSRELNQA